MPDEKKLCLSGSAVTKVFGFGRTKTLAVDHVDFNFYEGEVVSIISPGSGSTSSFTPSSSASGTTCSSPA